MSDKFSKHWLLFADFIAMITNIITDKHEDSYIEEEDFPETYAVVRAIINDAGDYVDYAVVGGSYDKQKNEFVILAVDQEICTSKSQDEVLELATHAMILDSKEYIEAQGYDWKDVKKDLEIQKADIYMEQEDDE